MDTTLARLGLIGLGGCIGSILRYLAGGYVQQWSGSIGFPYGTLFVNVVGCFVIGALSELAESRGVFTPETRAFVFVGILGGFTTFSTFANESVNLFRDGDWTYGLINVGAHIVLGLGAVWLGRMVAYLIWR